MHFRRESLAGPLLAEFYLNRRKRFDAEALANAPVINPLAFIAYAIGVIAALNAPDTVASLLVGLIASVIAYWLLSLAFGSKRELHSATQ
ncbi:hypothetical protein [Altererythrobacter lutimaris]|uniref:Uncharacterized protein n=1 Tax=Altererythrobacter lutimaris TaxID=2743979 RepID=A0A850HD27_9SPHN|nr:hypothetical protein [Altererythrobacter lutimaris]NVE95689.1 hypothetical protein [Altererythrobacter lutimaris]